MRTVLTVILLSFILTSFSQNSKVVSAYNYQRYGKLDKAKEAIDEAVQNEKTIGEAKAWFYRGNIYLDIANSTDSNFKKLDPDPLQKAFESYQQAMKLDEKQTYKEDIDKYLPAVAESYYNWGVVNYNMSNYKEAAKKFEKAYEVNKSIGKIDTTAIYNAAVSANIAGEDQMAKADYLKVMDLKYSKPDIYSSLSEIYKKEGDTAQALETIQQGRVLFPEDFNLLIAETNIYLTTNQKEKAQADLERAIDIDKTNPTIFFAVGTIYDQLGDFDKAKRAYTSALELKPDYFDANYNLGALYVNKAAEIQTKANDLPLNETEKYNAEKAKADSLLNSSIPYLEKALELQPGDVNAMVSLKEIYTRLGMTDRLEKINQMLQEK